MASYDAIQLTKYSVCITCSNEIGTVRESLNSLLGQLNENYEVIVVDNFSTDGTWEILQGYSNSGKIRLFRKKCSTGLGRQFAFLSSEGDFIIANLDLDDIFEPLLGELLEFYHTSCDGKLLAAFGAPPGRQVWLPNVTLGPRRLIRELGGWRDIQIGEDWDIWCRASKVGDFRTTLFPVAGKVGTQSRKEGAFGRTKRRYRSYRDRIRLGRDVFSPGEHVTSSQRATLLLARLATRFGTSFSEDYNKSFNPYDLKYFIANEATSRNPGAISGDRR